MLYLFLFVITPLLFGFVVVGAFFLLRLLGYIIYGAFDFGKVGGRDGLAWVRFFMSFLELFSRMIGFLFKNIINPFLLTFSLDDRSLFRQPILYVVIATALSLYVLISVSMMWGSEISITPEGVRNYFETTSTVSWVLALAVAGAALVARMHSSLQTEIQIKISSAQNNFNNYYTHKDKFSIKLREIQDSHHGNFYKSYELYRRIFPLNSVSHVDVVAHSADSKAHFFQEIDSLMYLAKFALSEIEINANSVNDSANGEDVSSRRLRDKNLVERYYKEVNAAAALANYRIVGSDAASVFHVVGFDSISKERAESEGLGHIKDKSKVRYNSYDQMMIELALVVSELADFCQYAISEDFVENLKLDDKERKKIAFAEGRLFFRS